MATNYPSGLDNTTVLKNNATDSTVTAVTHETAHNNIADALIAIETVLGINPNGGYASVAAALANMVAKTPSVNQVIQPSADHVALIIKAGSNLYTSNLFEGRLADDSIVAFLDKSGNFSAQGLKVNGTSIFASPTFTGAPQAPTPAGGDNSTKLATTAFVAAAVSGITTNTSGTLAARPAASVLSNGFYLATDQDVLYFSDGVNWHRQGLPAGATTYLFGASAVVPTGWVRYDGGTLGGSTGIYADLYAHLGNSTTLPDTRSRMPLDKGTNVAVSTIGNSDGVSIANRRPQHKHTPHNHTQNPHFHTYHAALSGPDSAQEWGFGHETVIDGNTSSVTATNNASDGGSGTSTDSVDTPPYIVGLLIAKL